MRRLMGKLRVRQKLILLVAFLALPYPLFLYTLLIEQGRAIDFSAREIDGAILLRQLAAATGRWFENTDPATARQRSGKVLSEMLKADAERLRSMDLYSQTEELSQSVAATAPLDRDAFLKSILQLNDDIGDRSNLILDPDLDTYYLMDIVLLRVTRLQRGLDQGARLAINDASETEILLRVGASADGLAGLRESMRRAQLANASLQQRSAMVTASGARIESCLQALELAAAGESPGAAQINQRCLAAQKDLHALQMQTINDLQRLLQKRVDGMRTRQRIQLGAIAGVSLLALILTVTVIRGIVAPLRAASTRLHQLSTQGGDLRARLVVEGGDESAELARGFNAFADRVAHAVRPAQEAAAERSRSGGELSGNSSALRDFAQEQVAAVEEITAALEETASAADSVDRTIEAEGERLMALGKRMQDLHAALQAMRGGVERGAGISDSIGDRVREADQSMAALQESMNRLSEISGGMQRITRAIQDISDRVNLLALNAAIEAARAGDAGRGFAVVADEVGRLAEQTQRSIRDINSLIGGSAAEIEKSIQRASETGSAMSFALKAVADIAAEVAVLAKRLPEQENIRRETEEQLALFQSQFVAIRTMSREQKMALDEAVHSSADINRLAQETARTASEQFAAAEALSQVAARLRSEVDSFQV